MMETLLYMGLKITFEMILYSTKRVSLWKGTNFSTIKNKNRGSFVKAAQELKAPFGWLNGSSLG